MTLTTDALRPGATFDELTLSKPPSGTPARVHKPA
jgi:hypothetical protein